MSAADKIAQLVEAEAEIERTTPTHCFASKTAYGYGCIIDVLKPGNQVTAIYGSTLEECRERHPDAELMTIQAFCEWKAEQQDTPITWEPTTRRKYLDMLGVLPPIGHFENNVAGGFLVSEPADHHALTGQARYQAFKHEGSRYFFASRPLSRAEWKELNK